MKPVRGDFLKKTFRHHQPELNFKMNLDGRVKRMIDQLNPFEACF